MTTFTKENEGKTFIIGQRLSNRQSKARASAVDSYREVELKFIKITDKSVVYEVTLNGITHKIKSMIQMDTKHGASGTHRYIKFTKKAVWGVFHGTIAYEVGFIEKEDEDFGTECQLGNSASCGCPSCVEKYKSDEEDEMPEDEHFCKTCTIPLVEDDFDPNTGEPYTGECESCREGEPTLPFWMVAQAADEAALAGRCGKVVEHKMGGRWGKVEAALSLALKNASAATKKEVSILEENCGNCGKKELLRFCDGCQFVNVGIGGFCSNCRISDSDNDVDCCLDCSAKGACMEAMLAKANLPKYR